MIHLFRKVGITAALALTPFASASAQNIGLLGGDDLTSGVEMTEPPLGFLASAPSTITDLNLFNLLSAGFVISVSINNSGLGLIGGQNNTSLITVQPPFLAFVNAAGMPSTIDLSGTIPKGYVNSVAINSSGLGLIAGQNLVNPTEVPYAFTITPSGTIGSQVTFPSSATTGGTIESIALNDAGTGLGGGDDQNGAAMGLILLPSTTTFVDLQLNTFVADGFINSVAINQSGAGLFGGQVGHTFPNPAVAFYLTPPMTVTQLDLTSIPSSTNATFVSVAINDSGAGILGGYNNDGNAPPIAYLVSSTAPHNVTDLDLASHLPPSLPSGNIFGAAINNSGLGLIGGNIQTDPLSSTFVPLGFLISPTGQLTDLMLSSFVPAGEISAVALNENGVGILVGYALVSGMEGSPIAFLVCQTGEVIQLDLSSFTMLGVVNTVSINDLFFLFCPSPTPPTPGCRIPTNGLKKNDLHLAKYINKYAPYDACYFVPSEMDGTLKQALESTAPTRNAFALFTADNNLFFLNTMVSRHSRDSRSFRRQISQEFQMVAMGESVPAERSPETLLASIPVPTYCRRPELEPCEDERPYQLWGSVLGALSYQKAQNQSPAFNPTTGGAILAFDAKVTTHAWLGGGAAYVYSHIHEKQDAGHSNINQELLFLYSLWDNTHLYFDAVLWGGLFQVDNVRHIHMTGFEFTSKSHPKGWQLSPHVELGYDINSESNRFTVEPFVMFDWANNWQHCYKEKGSGPFNMVQKHQHSSFLRSETGVRFYEVVPYENWSLVFQETAGYVNKKPFKVGTVNAFIVGAPGSFTVETFTTTQNLGVVEFELLFEPNDPRYPYGTVAYQGEFGSQYQSHLVSFDICWNF